MGNPEVGKAPNRYDQAHEKGSGFGFITFDPVKKTYAIDSFRFLIDPTGRKPTNQFPGWPVTIHQSENRGQNRLEEPCTRRTFLQSASALALTSLLPLRSFAAAGPQPKFSLKYAPHPGTFKNKGGEDYLDQVRFAADQGFTAWEDNGVMKQTPAMQEKNRRRARPPRHDDGRVRRLRQFRPADVRATR